MKPGRGPSARFVFLAALILAMRLLPSFAADTDVVINEIMYHPDTDCEGEEFIELHNRSATEAVDLSNWRFVEGIRYTFPAGTTLDPGAYLVVCGDVDTFNRYYGGSGTAPLGPWEGKLSNNGEDIELVNAAGTRVNRVRYNDKRPWPISPDGAGPSLELINPNDANSSGGAWRAADANWYSTTWQYYEVAGVASSTTVYLYLDGEGECFIDDVELRATTNPVTNHIINGGFEAPLILNWTATGNHAGSLRETTEARSGSASLKVVSTGAGGIGGLVWQRCLPPTFNGPRYTLSFWAKGLKPGLILRVGLRGGEGSGWTPTTSEDIGNPPTAGGYSYDPGNDTYSVHGSGADIWGTSDQFHYVYALMEGDGSLEATVSWVGTPPNSWAKSGIMIRQDNSAGAPYVYALLRRDYAVYLQWRTNNSTAGPTPGGPTGLRLTREGDKFTAEANTGAGWSEYATANLPMNPSVLIGLAVTSHAGAPLATADFTQPVGNVGSGFFTEVSVPNFAATPGSLNSRYAANLPPYIRNVDTAPDQPTSRDAIEVRAKITDADGVTFALLSYQIVKPGQYIRLGDPAYQTNWTNVAMSPATTPSYWVATIPAQAHRTLVRYRVSAQDGAGQVTTVPYSDDTEPNYARFVYDGIPTYRAAQRPGSTPFRTHTNLTKVPVIHLIANAADVQEAQAVAATDKVERRQFKWRGTLFFNGKVYDHIRYRMRGGTWRYKYNKRMWKFRFNRGHRLDFIRNDGTEYEEEVRTLNLFACIQPPGNVSSWVNTKYGDNSQRGEAGFIDRAGFWLFRQVGSITCEATWIHFRIIDDASEAGVDPDPSGPDRSQYYGDFFGLYLAGQGMDERMLRMSGRPVGNLYKMDSFGALPGQPPWFQDAIDCSLPADDIYQFRSDYGSNPPKSWWEANFELDHYYSTRAVVECIHHGDISGGKNYYYYHNPINNKWEFVAWDLDLCFGTDFGAGASPFRDRVIRNAAIPEFGVAYKNRLREVIQLLFCQEKFFPVLDEWRDLLIEIATADMDRWDYAPQTGSLDFSWQGHFKPLDTRLADIKYWIGERVKWLTNPPDRDWWLEARHTWPRTTCWDPDIPATPTLTAPGNGALFRNQEAIALRASTYSDPNGTPHAASKWIATRVGGNELQPDWTSGISTFWLTSGLISPGALAPGRYWLRVRYGDATDRWSWWSDPVEIEIVNVSSAARNWQRYH